MTKRAITYARVSYDDRGTDGRNLDSQRDMCRGHCDKRGHTIVRELHEDDKGASGADFDLPGIIAIMDMARAGEFEVLVVRELDRLARDYIKAEVTRRDLLKLGIEIEYVLYELPPGPIGDMMRRQLASFAEFVRQDTIAKTARGRRNSVKSGNVSVAGRPPYGYAVEEDKRGDKVLTRRLVPSEPEASIVRMLFDLYTQGDNPLTINGITRHLSDLGVGRPSDANPAKAGHRKKDYGQWNARTVHQMLSSPTYVGDWRYGKHSHERERCKDPNCKRHLPDTPPARRYHYKTINHVDGVLAVTVPALVSPATWQAAQERLKLNQRNAWRPAQEPYLLRTRLTCAKCGSGMQCTSAGVSKTGQKYRYYTCCARASQLKYGRVCGAKALRADWVDAEVWGWIRDLLTKPEKLKKAISELEAEGERLAEPTTREIASLDELIGEHKAQLTRIKNGYESGFYNLDEATAKKAQHEGDLKRLGARRDKLQRIIDTQVRSTDQVRAVLAFAENQKGRVERATQDFEVRRGLMADLHVDARLGYEGEIPVVNADSVFGQETFRQVGNTTSSGEQPTNSGVVLSARLSLADYLFARVGKRASVVVQ